MSYDLFFFKKAESVTSSNEIKRYLNQLPHVKTNDLGTLWEYHNNETEAYCKFEMSNADSNADTKESEAFPGFKSAKLSFNINYIRPISFGKECFPIVDKLVSDLNLFILNPQGEETPQIYPEGDLQKEWSEFNANLARFQKPNMSIFERYMYGIY